MEDTVTAKQAMIEVLQAAPDDAEWGDLMDELFLVHRLEQCQQAEERGEIYTTEQAMEKLGLCPPSSAG